MKPERVEAQLRNLERLIDDPPPLLSLVILANGTGIAYAHPLFDGAGRGTPQQRTAAMMLVRAYLREFDAMLEDKLDEIIRATAGTPGKH